MFQKRLTGESIGFSVLGIFVINKRAVLSVSFIQLSISLIPILLLLLQLIPQSLQHVQTSTQKSVTVCWPTFLKYDFGHGLQRKRIIAEDISCRISRANHGLHHYMLPCSELIRCYLCGC